MPKPVKVGVVGCGAISAAYFTMAKNFPILDIAAVADLDLDRARAKAAEFNIPKACSVDELLADPAIEVVLNLTVPKAHVPVALAAIAAGKHTYAEKPLALTVDEAKNLLAAAKKKKLCIGCAPDTVLGAGIQTARKLIDDGAIGRPVAFTAFMLCPGHESWHPSPEFYYEVGGGPMFDMGPYYLTALLQLLGKPKRLSGIATIAIPQRTITHKDKTTGGPGPKFGKQLTVETPDHVAGLLEFENGCAGSIVTSFATRFPSHDPKQPITIYGTEGTLRVPDPNGFDGPVHLRKTDDPDWTEVPHAFVKGYGRAVGLADLCYSIRNKKRTPRCDGQQALAVTEMMQAFLDSSTKGKTITLKTKYPRPLPMPATLPFGHLDE